MPKYNNTEEFVAVVRKLFPEYDYSLVEYVDLRTHVLIKCNKHGIKRMRPDQLLEGHRCRQCSIDANTCTTESFIKKARLKHGDRYDYSLTNYINKSCKVTIICKIHGAFSQNAASHINQSCGCKKCAIEEGKPLRRSTKEQFITKCQKTYPDANYDYSKVEYVDYNTEVILICPIHDEFKITPDNLFHGVYCHDCKKEKQRQVYANEFLCQAKEKFGSKFDYSKVKYVDTKTDVEIICDVHGSIMMRPGSHLWSITGCHKCGMNKTANDIKLTTEQFIAKATEYHNNRYDYSKTVYTRACDPIIIGCLEHNFYSQIASDHISGTGCPDCGRKQRSDATRLTLEEFIIKSNEAHNNKYDYTMSEYTGTANDVNIICKEHGMYITKAGYHLKGSGTCPVCYKILIGLQHRLTNDEYIERANKVHNFKYDYSDMNFTLVTKPINIRCKTHEIVFTRRADGHLAGYGCPSCNKCPSCLLWKTMGAICEYCQPKEKNKPYTKTKEYTVVQHLKEKFPDHEFIHNKSVGKDCTDGHLYPDIRFDFGHYNLIIEVDEHKHRGADYKCDKQRMYDIIAKLGIPCIFIRYNPDSKSSNIEKLVETIHDYIDMEPEDDPLWNKFGHRAIYLFYN